MIIHQTLSWMHNVLKLTFNKTLIDSSVTKVWKNVVTVKAHLSRPLVGSSRKSIRGRVKISMAILTRRFSPPLSPRTNVPVSNGRVSAVLKTHFKDCALHNRFLLSWRSGAGEPQLCRIIDGFADSESSYEFVWLRHKGLPTNHTIENRIQMCQLQNSGLHMKHPSLTDW